MISFEVEKLQALMQKSTSITIKRKSYPDIVPFHFIEVLACTDMGKFQASCESDSGLEDVFVLLLKMRNDRELGIYPK